MAWAGLGLTGFLWPGSMYSMPLGTDSGFPCLLYKRGHTTSGSSYPCYKRSTAGLTSIGKQAHHPGLSVWTVEEEMGVQKLVWSPQNSTDKQCSQLQQPAWATGILRCLQQQPCLPM